MNEDLVENFNTNLKQMKNIWEPSMTQRRRIHGSKESKQRKKRKKEGKEKEWLGCVHGERPIHWILYLFAFCSFFFTIFIDG